jgi:hypothetical protein
MEWVAIGHILWVLLYWPGGIILGNLLASLIWSSIFEWRLGVHRRKTDRNVDKKIANHQLAMSDMLDVHHRKIVDHINNKLSMPLVEIKVEDGTELESGPSTVQED